MSQSNIFKPIKSKGGSGNFQRQLEPKSSQKYATKLKPTANPHLSVLNDLKEREIENQRKKIIMTQKSQKDQVGFGREQPTTASKNLLSPRDAGIQNSIKKSAPLSPKGASSKQGLDGENQGCLESSKKRSQQRHVESISKKLSEKSQVSKDHKNELQSKKSALTERQHLEGEKASRDIPAGLKGDDVECEMDETIVDFQEERVAQKKIKTDIKNFNRVKRDFSKQKTHTLKGSEGKPEQVDALTLTLPLTDRNNLSQKKIHIGGLKSFREKARKQKGKKSFAENQSARSKGALSKQQTPILQTFVVPEGSMTSRLPNPETLDVLNLKVGQIKREPDNKLLKLKSNKSVINVINTVNPDNNQFKKKNMYSYLNKNSSPKRNTGSNTQVNSQVKGPRASIERKDLGRTAKADGKPKQGSAGQGAPNIYLLGRSDAPNASMGKLNAPISRDLFHSKERKSILDQFYQASRGGSRVQEESKPSPTKYKKLQHGTTSGYKNNAATQNRASKLNQSTSSIEKSRQGKSQERGSNFELKSVTMDDRKRISNNSIGGGYPNMQGLQSASGASRIGIHQNQGELDFKAESRQMVQSPFKTKPVMKKAHDPNTGSLGIISNQYLRGIGTSSKKQSITVQKNLASSLKQTKGDQKSAQRSLVNSTSAHPEEATRSFNSKSPSKKSVQLQSILRSLNQPQQTSVSASKNKRMSNNDPGSTTKSGSLIRNFINQVTQPTQQSPTKAGKSLRSSNASYGNSLQHRSNPSHSMVGVNLSNNYVHNQDGTIQGLTNRTSSVNPYIQNITNRKSFMTTDPINEKINDSKNQSYEPQDAMDKMIEDMVKDQQNLHSERLQDLLITENQIKEKTFSKKYSQASHIKQASEKKGSLLNSKTKLDTQNNYLYSQNINKSQLIQRQSNTKTIQSPQNSQNKPLFTERLNSDLLTNTVQRRKKNERNSLVQESQKGAGVAGKRDSVAGKAQEHLQSKKKITTTNSKYNNKYLPRDFKKNNDIHKESSLVRQDKGTRSEIEECDEMSTVPAEIGIYQSDINLESSENIDDVQLQQQHVQTPKKLSDLKKKNHGNKSGEYTASKNNFQSPMVNYDKKTQGVLAKTAPKGSNYVSNRKETKYAAISFSNEKQDEPAVQKVSNPASIEKVQSKISLAPYEDQDNSRSIDDELERNENQDSFEPFFGENRDDAHEASGMNQRQDQNRLSLTSDKKVNNQRQESFGPETDSSWPMGVDHFLDLYSHVMLSEEIQELKKQKMAFDTIYFAGSIPNRSLEDLESLKSANRDKASTFQEKKDSIDQNNNNGEYQGNPAFDNHEGYYQVQIGEHLAYRYEIMKILGKGSFAQVVQCRDHKNPGSPLYAVKITRNTEMDHKFAHKEAQYLKYIMQEDPQDKHNIVRMVDQAYFRDHHCFVFELLHTDLFEHLKATGFVGFSTDKIKDYAVQILKGLVFLEKHKIIHCDLKPENILCADTMCRDLKIVDFGSGCFRDEQIYTYVQSRFYRSPEVILRIKYTEKVDIWSLGCILAELYTGEPLFPGNNEQEQLELIMEMCGMPPESMIDKSRKKDHYFDTDYSPFLIEDEELGILRIPSSRMMKEAVPCEDEEFLQFISKCLEIDPETRFSASEAMEHPWLKNALHQSMQKKKIVDPRMVDKQMPAKRMGQNESAEHLYQPQILREKEIREREGMEIPTEYSPDRDVIAQRKKPVQKPNQESFGIKLNNLNILGSSSKKHSQPKDKENSSQKKQKGEIKVSDFINEQKTLGNYQSLPRFKKTEQTEESEVASSSNSNNAQIKNNQYGGVESSQNLKNQYYSIYQQQSETDLGLHLGQPNHSSSYISKHKSIIPEIDFTNKYVRKANNFNSGNNDSMISSTVQDQNTSIIHQQPLSASIPQQQSPFRNKFSHLSQMEQISQFDKQSDEAFPDEEEFKAQAITRNSHLSNYQVEATGGNSVSFGSRNNSSVKKKPQRLQNNFMQPSP